MRVVVVVVDATTRCAPVSVLLAYFLTLSLMVMVVAVFVVVATSNDGSLRRQPGLTHSICESESDRDRDRDRATMTKKMVVVVAKINSTQANKRR